MPQLRFHSAVALDKVQLLGFSTLLVKPGKESTELAGVGSHRCQKKRRRNKRPFCIVMEGKVKVIDVTACMASLL